MFEYGLNVPFELLLVADDSDKEVWLTASIFFVSAKVFIDQGITDLFIQELEESARLFPWAYAPFSYEARYLRETLGNNLKELGEESNPSFDKVLDMFKIISDVDLNSTAQRTGFVSAWSAISKLYREEGSEVCDNLLTSKITEIQNKYSNSAVS